MAAPRRANAGMNDIQKNDRFRIARQRMEAAQLSGFTGLLRANVGARNSTWGGDRKEEGITLIKTLDRSDLRGSSPRHRGLARIWRSIEPAMTKKRSGPCCRRVRGSPALSSSPSCLNRSVWCRNIESALLIIPGIPGNQVLRTGSAAGPFFLSPRPIQVLRCLLIPAIPHSLEADLDAQLSGAICPQRRGRFTPINRSVANPLMAIMVTKRH